MWLRVYYTLTTPNFKMADFLYIHWPVATPTYKMADIDNKNFNSPTNELQL